MQCQVADDQVESVVGQRQLRHVTGIQLDPVGRAFTLGVAPCGIRAVAGLVSAPQIDADADDLETLDADCATGSLRRAAGLIHLHYSSVARRLEQIGRILGTDLTEPAG